MSARAHELQLWGGHECTVNRLGDRFVDQTVLSGHQERLSDLELFAGLGVTALRYPVLWERVSPRSPDARDWRWSDERLGELRRLGVRPIVGLVHHGSGPAYTSLLDEGFAEGLAAHARAVADRYPWVREWTPVNEPLTTARFSALYGLWYPHLRDEGALWLALLNQIDATRLAMKAIREVIPDARLIQTEDLGFTHARAGLEEQAAFENHRRWLTWDLLCGRVTPTHPLFSRIARHGLEARLAAIAADPCPPDVIGVNHYLTSERLLDDRLERYPPHTHGGSDKRRYADVEAVRAAAEGPLGLETLLDQAWRRYGRTLAVTEVHNGCTRDEQMRWLLEAWRACERLRADGVDVEAVTAWSLLGAYDWDSLLTRQRGHYEPGVFDLRGGEPRPTAAAELMRALAAGREPEILGLAREGWWRRDVRMEYPPVPAASPTRRAAPPVRIDRRPILITGRTGTLGQALARACRLRDLPYVLTDRARLPIEGEAAVREAIEQIRPAAVINAAGWVRVDEAEDNAAACMRANAEGPELLAQACERAGLPFVAFSSDLVFDGLAGRAYVEGDATAPLGVYGRSKAECERRVLAVGGKALVIRTAAFFQAEDAHNFAVHCFNALSAGERFAAAEDCFVSPTHVPDLTHATLDLLIDGETGLWHLANPGRFSWAGFARTLAEAARLDPGLVEGVGSEAMGWRATRPADVHLGSERGALLKPAEDAIDRFLHAWRRRSADGEAGTRSACVSGRVELQA